MKKIISAAVIAVMLCACSNDGNPEVPDIPMTDMTPQPEQTTSAEADTSISEASAAEETTSEEQPDETEPVISDAYKALYKDVLYAHVQADPAPDDVLTKPMFSLYDITGDGIPELFISDGEFHAATVMIFTESEGSLLQLTAPADENYVYDSFGSWGMCRADSEGYLWSGYMGMGAASVSIYRLEGKEFGHVISFTEFDEYYEDENGESGTYRYFVDGVQTEEAEYTKIRSEYDDRDWAQPGRDFDILPEVIEEMLQ